MSNEGFIKCYNVGVGLFEPSSSQREQKILSKLVFEYSAKFFAFHGIAKEDLLSATTDDGSDVKYMSETSEYFGLRYESCLAHVVNMG